MNTTDEKLLGKYRIVHELFEGIVFSDEGAALDAAERLCVFLIQNTSCREVRIDILKYHTDKGCDGIETIWWYSQTAHAELTVGDSDH